jgi:chromosome segregation ATPase
MASRALPILNAIGCLALTGLVVAQWQREHRLDGTLARLRSELATAKNQAAEEAKRRAALENDISVLKESIEATQNAAESSARLLAEKGEHTARLEADLNTAREQVTAWETALKARDERIRTLDAELTASRKRLDEAIARLKSAGAR